MGFPTDGAVHVTQYQLTTPYDILHTKTLTIKTPSWYEVGQWTFYNKQL